eukprot:SAG11_NODE_1713_length_4398_cov_5.942080_3_plen_121_part_00
MRSHRCFFGHSDKSPRIDHEDTSAATESCRQIEEKQSPRLLVSARSASVFPPTVPYSLLFSCCVGVCSGVSGAAHASAPREHRAGHLAAVLAKQGAVCLPSSLFLLLFLIVIRNGSSLEM